MDHQYSIHGAGLVDRMDDVSGKEVNKRPKAAVARVIYRIGSTGVGLGVELAVPLR